MGVKFKIDFNLVNEFIVSRNRKAYVEDERGFNREYLLYS